MSDLFTILPQCAQLILDTPVFTIAGTTFSIGFVLLLFLIISLIVCVIVRSV